MDYVKIGSEVQSLARKAGEFIQEERKKLDLEQVEVKGLHNYVTEVDKASERMLTEELQKILPEAGFIVEEETIEKKHESINWIVDPIDGTTNFIHGIPCYSISIGLQAEGEMKVGVIYEANLKESFSAVRGEGAFLNGKPISVSKRTEFGESLLATGFPYTDYGKLDEYLALFKHFIKETRGLRRLGSAAVDLAYVACGRCEGFYEYGLFPWDVAAGALIVEEAGGKVTDFQGGNGYLSGKEIVASNSSIHDPFLKAIREYFCD